MKILTEKYPDTDFYFILGGDMVEYLPKWYKVDELMQLVQFVGVKRPNYPTETSYPIIWIDVPDMNISSTDLRKKNCTRLFGELSPARKCVTLYSRKGVVS